MAIEYPGRFIRLAVVAQLAIGGLAVAQSTQPGQPAPSADWPREVDSDVGVLVVYEPQADAFQGQTLSGRSAFALTPKGKTEPVFGAMWFSANVSTDRDQRLIQVLSGKVTRIAIPDTSPEVQQTLTQLLEKQLPSVSLSLDSVTSALADGQESGAAADDLQTEPPKVLFATEPTVLVLLDGRPIRRPIEKSGIDAVVNTPFPIFYDGKTKLYYLTNGAIWFQTPDILGGPWQVIAAPPSAVVEVVTKGDKKDQSAPAPADAAPPRIVVATEPTELIVTKGVPNFAPVGGTQLLQVTNADESIFRDLNSQALFIVLAGRWYTAKSFEGPWAFVASNHLPADFANIPAGSPAGNVLAFVSGTPQAKQAVADSEIPQTAEIRRDAPPPTITYDGQPNFQPVTGGAPDVSYAANSPASVLKIGGAYYAVVNAVWYTAPGPEGPWSVATAVPEQVQTIPPASPVYNVRYVTIYQATPEVVYTGYTPGYLGCYAWNGTVVYGTGYVYRPWVSSVVYYPRPVTWGFNVAYNPYTGWSYGAGPSAGFLSYGATWGGSYYRPPWRPAYGGAWYGPGGYRPPPPYYAGGWYSPGYRTAYYRPGGPYYGGRPAYAGAWARPAGSLYQRPAVAHAVVQRPVQPLTLGRPAGPAARSMNLVADKSGHVLRQAPNGTWQQHDNKAGWKPVSAPGPIGRPSGPVAHPTSMNSPGHGAFPAAAPAHPVPGSAQPGHPPPATAGPPGTQPHAGPPGTQPHAGPPGTQTHAGPPGTQPHAGPPGTQPHAGPPGTQPHAGPPGTQTHAGPPGTQTHAGPPGTQPHAGPPGTQPHAGPPGTQTHAGPPGTQPHAGPPGTQTHAGPPAPQGHPAGEGHAPPPPKKPQH